MEAANACRKLERRLRMHVHCKKGFPIFPSPAGMSQTKLSLDGNYDVIYKLFLHRESLVSDIPAGDGNIEKLFLQCMSLERRLWMTEGNLKEGCGCMYET